MTKMLDRLVSALAEFDENQHHASYYRGAVTALLLELKTPTQAMLQAVEDMPQMAEAKQRPLARPATTEERWREMIDAALDQL